VLGGEQHITKQTNNTCDKVKDSLAFVIERVEQIGVGLPNTLTW